MRKSNPFHGMLQVRILSADFPGLLSKMMEVGIVLSEIEETEPLAYTSWLHRKHWKQAEKICEKVGSTIQIEKKTGGFFLIQQAVSRPLLLAGVAIIIFATLFLPNRVLFVTVEGESEVPAQQILEYARSYGVHFGAERRIVRSEAIKNALLQSLPELQWIGINTKGCVASIHVRASHSEEEIQKSDHRVSNIVAIRDGIIVSSTVLQGSSLCTEGQAVKEGEVLISGYTDCGLVVRAEQAVGEVLAQTFHEINIVAPNINVMRGTKTDSEVKYSLLIGKKIINFYKDSGISDSRCVRIYEEKYLTLPGGFSLPVALVKEQWTYYELQTDAAQVNSIAEAERYAENYMKSQMVAGEILTQQFFADSDSALCRLQAVFSCVEQIGRNIYEEQICRDGTHYG